MLKRLSHCLILISFGVLFSACFSERISNTKDNKGDLYVSGTWPKNLKTSNITNAKSIPQTASTIKIKVSDTDGITIEKSVSKTSDSTSFDIAFSDLEIGNWEITGEAIDENGNVVGTTQSKSITVVNGSNSFSAVFGPVTYSELFLEDSFYKLLGDYTHHFDVMAYLEVDKIEYQTAEAYKKTSGSNDDWPESRERFTMWSEYETLDSTTESAIFLKEEGSSYYDGEIVAVINYNYTDDKITSAKYTNDSSTNSSIVSGYDSSKNITVNTTISYNSEDRISSFSNSGTYNDGSDKTFGEEVTASYSNGNFILAEFIDSSNETETVTFGYSGGRMTSFSMVDSERSETDTITWANSNQIEKMVASGTENGESKTKTGTFSYNSTTEKLEEVVWVESSSQGTYTQTINYYYEEETSNNNTYEHLSKITYTSNSQLEYEIIFYYQADEPNRVDSVYYHHYYDGTNYYEMFSDKLYYVGETN